VKQFLLAPPQALKERFPVDGFGLAAFEVVVAAVQHPAHLGQLVKVTGHGILNQLIRGTAGFGRQLVELGFQLGFKMYFHAICPHCVAYDYPRPRQLICQGGSARGKAASGVDEQALLAKVCYNRLIDIFTGVTCYSLQNHLRTTVAEMGQVETDEIYVGVDRRGAQYVFPVQPKGGTDKLNIVQIEQDFAVCAQKFPALICRAFAAQFMEDDLIALFGFEISEDGVALTDEKHYRLVEPDDISAKDLQT
jgi:hypothetical protein